jgi:hypothetical protein
MIMKSFKLVNLLIIMPLALSCGRAVDPYKNQDDPEAVFMNPPESAKPGVLWMWMGSNISREGITKDLEALKEAGFNRTTMFHLSDITTSLSVETGNRPGPEIISRTGPWWEMVQFAAEESERLGMDFGMHNCPGYETSGGTWITPEHSMQDIIWSEQKIKGNRSVSIKLKKPETDLRSTNYIPFINRETGVAEKPIIPERKTWYRDIAVVAVPSGVEVMVKDVVNITEMMEADGTLYWDAPAGDWHIYRFGHTTTGSQIFPAQWQATGFECDKMNQEAVDFHLDHIISEIKNQLGNYIGKGFTHVHFDSYEAGMPGWTPKMPEEFIKRRGYDIIPWLPVFTGRKIGTSEDSLKFRHDFDATVKDLYRDIYFATISKKLAEANLKFLSEPYGGPWRVDEVIPHVDKVMTEFFTDSGKFSPYQFETTVQAIRKSGKNLIESEAFTGRPPFSRWTETPAWLKPIGDEAYCAGSNRFIVHRFVHQPWGEKYRPGATMGVWGTHFDRTQTWWEPAKAMVKYWQRCQALLQWGQIAHSENNPELISEDQSLRIRHIHRKLGKTEVFFVANTAHSSGNAECIFNVTGIQPELWDPVTGTIRDLPEFEDSGTAVSVPLKFEDAQSFFIVFRKKLSGKQSDKPGNFTPMKDLASIDTPWKVTFDPAWGGPEFPVVFDKLEDWISRPEPGIKYYSGTATYRSEFDFHCEGSMDKEPELFLDLGTVRDIARVIINGRDLGIIWTAPWNVKIPGEILLERGNTLEVEITNTWVNRLIGDEQEHPDAEWAPAHYGPETGVYMKEFPDWFVRNLPRPSKNRYCFTNWNYFRKDSSLVSSGLLGPVTLKASN